MNIAADLGHLPDYYKSVRVHVHNEPISPEVELTRWLAEREQRLGARPVTLFRNVIGHPGAAVLGNPCPKPVLLAAMGIAEDDWLPALGQRLTAPTPAPGTQPVRWRELAGLHELPVPQHRPGDAGRYITAGVTITCSVDGELNLGVYRIQVVGPDQARVFFDPRTDAHRIWRQHIDAGRTLPVTVFIGADPVYLLAGASRLPVSGSDFDVAAKLRGSATVLDEEFGVPADTQYVVQGEVGADLATEGPFAEFKGYYVPARQSPVMAITRVVSAQRPFYPTIVTGNESGLTLMSLQNEYLMYAHLTGAGFPVERVWYPHSARAEFLAVITSSEPSRDLLRTAMEFDQRAKVVVCGRDPDDVWQTVASHGFTAETAVYHRKGEEYGHRIGLLFDREAQGTPVEF
jgi:2,5-furandicarboxylate decarboxylase 1